MSTRKKLFITGAAGMVGSALRRYLRDQYDMRLMFHSNIPDDLESDDEITVSDLSDFEAMVEAGDGVDAIVHLGIATKKKGYPRSRYNQMIMDTNVQGTYNIFEAARINKIPKVIFASSNAVTGMYEKEGVHTTWDMPPRPRDFYGVSKAFGEALGRHYHDAYGLSVFCIRICNFPNTDTVNKAYEPGMNRWLSARDMAALTACCLEAPDPQFGVFYGVSGGAEKKWDVSNAKEQVGWEPMDNGAE